MSPSDLSKVSAFKTNGKSLSKAVAYTNIFSLSMRLTVLWKRKILSEMSKMIKLIVAVLLTSISIAANAQWIEYAQEESGPIYYEKSRVASTGAGILVWEKLVMDQEALREAIKENPSFNNYSHTLTKNFYNCHTYQYQKASVYAYSKDGKLLLSNSNVEGSHYQDIVPDSVKDKLVKIICKNK